MPVLANLKTFAIGARVRKPSAVAFDFAFGRVGTVYREDERVGVLWDGGRAIVEYPAHLLFEPAEDAPAAPVN